MGSRLVRQSLALRHDSSRTRREALMRVGGVEQTNEIYRERRGLHVIETLLQDLLFGARMLRKNPGFTVVAVLTLALSIGANTAIFSVIDAVLLRPLPYKNSDQLVSIAANNVQRGINGLPVSFTKMTRVREQTRTLQSVGAYYPLNASLTTHGAPEQVSAARATAGFFEVLGVAPAAGRGFLSEEDREGGAEIAIISDGFWHSHFGAAPDLIGQTIPLDGKSVTVVGVLPASFHFPFAQPEPDVWLPRVFDPVALTPTMIRTGASFLAVFARLQAGVSSAQSQEELDAINEAYVKDFPGYVDASNYTLQIVSLKER